MLSLEINLDRSYSGLNIEIMSDSQVKQMNWLGSEQPLQFLRLQLSEAWKVGFKQEIIKEEIHRNKKITIMAGSKRTDSSKGATEGF